MSISQSEGSMCIGFSWLVGWVWGFLFLCFYEYHIIHKEYEHLGIFIIYKKS